MTEAERHAKILDAQNFLFERQFLAFAKHVTGPVAVEKVRLFAPGGNLEPVLGHVDDYILKLSNALPYMFLEAAKAEAAHLADQLKVQKAPSKLTDLDLTDPRIQRALTDPKLRFARDLTRQQRDLIRQSLVEGIRRGENADQLARRFQATVGLTRSQREQVAGYQRALETGSTQALQYVMRDTKFDARVERSIDENDILDASQINRMVGAYAVNLRNYRAKIIAGAQSLQMVNSARNMATRQVAEAAGINPSRGRKRWVARLINTRETHEALHEQVVGMDEAFTSPSGARLQYPGDTSMGAGPAEIVNCQCSVEYLVGD